MSRASGQPTAVTDTLPAGTPERAFGETLRRLGVAPPFALAVSGGGDSVALMHLAARWARGQGFDPKSIAVLTVDHGLRAGSRAEAEHVGGWARALGFAHHILSWEGEKPGSGIQERARIARRELLCAWCRGAGVQSLLVAHTADDQAETVAMRLGRGSGPTGLAGMAAESGGPFSIRILRPLLGAMRSDLRAWLRREGISWIEDPSNEDVAFERVRMRKELDADPARRDRLLALAAPARRARDEADDLADEILQRAAELHGAGWARVDLEVLRAAPEAAARLALQRLMTGLGGAEHPPRRDSLDRLWTEIVGKGFSGATLAGCLVVPEGQKSALFGREARNLSRTVLTARQWRMWDNRFELRASAAAEVLPLRAVGLDAFAGEARERVKHAAPPAFRDALPVVAFGERDLSVPHAGVSGGGTVEVLLRGMRPFGALGPRETAGGV